MAEDPLQNAQLDPDSPINTLSVSPQSPPDDTVKVEAGATVLADNETIVPFPGGSTAAFPSLGVGEVSRWDLVTLDLNGATPVLSVLAGTPSMGIQNWEDSVPVLPSGRMALAAVQITEETPTVPEIVAEDIVDVRSYYHAVRGIVGGGYVPTVPADWIVPPATTTEALDELADRLTTGITPSFVGVLSTPGTSKEAARADHVHNHANLSGFIGNTHHAASQVAYQPANLSDWLFNFDPGDTDDALDQLASRTKILENTNAFRNKKVFTANGNLIVPPNVFRIYVELWGGGGGGGGCETSEFGAGGGAGGSYARALMDVTPGESIGVIIGNGGGGGDGATGANGGVGGGTTVLDGGATDFISVGGGNGGIGTSGLPAPPAAAGGIANSSLAIVGMVTDSVLFIPGQNGHRGPSNDLLGGSGDGGDAGGGGGKGGVIRGDVVPTPGVAGEAPGGGGSGGAADNKPGAQNGAAGGQGRAILWW